jgi:hypothetical protein
MSQSWIVRAHGRAFAWVLFTSLRFFIWLVFLAVPSLAIFVTLLGFTILLHSLGVVPHEPSDVEVSATVFAGIVISLLLCIGLGTGAFEGLVQKEK